MNGARSTPEIRPRRREILAVASCGIGCAGISPTFGICRAVADRHCPTARGRQQRQATSQQLLFGDSGLEKPRYSAQITPRTGSRRFHCPDTKGSQAKESSLVCRDLGGTGLDTGNGNCKGHFRAGTSRTVLQERSIARHHENVMHRPPPHGIESAVYVPPHGIERVPLIPPHGTVHTHLDTFLIPPHGEYLDIAICIGE